MKKIVILSLLFFFTHTIAQEKLITKTGKIIFEASVPSFEEVKAINEGVSCVLNPETGEISSLVLLKEFRFQLALMEEHFNKNYIESDDYPKSTFKGKIVNFDFDKLTNTYTEFTIKGKLELHGKKKEIIILAKIRKNNAAGIEIISNFPLNASDFNINIPLMVKNKVSNVVNVSINYLLQ